MPLTPLYEFEAPIRRGIIFRHLRQLLPDASVSQFNDGAFGSVFMIKDALGARIAAKCPIIRPFDSRHEARDAICKLIREAHTSTRLSTCPWSNQFYDIRLIHGWPFVLSQYHDGTLFDQIADPLSWSIGNKLATIIQLNRCLEIANQHGVQAHQDLKPANIFIKIIPNTEPRLMTKVGDWGIADAFHAFGRNGGSRPYMAPEQYTQNQISPPVRIDQFAVGVIAYEILTDGLHPMGIKTMDFWPRHIGGQKKWEREDVWKKWARSKDKELPHLSGIPEGIRSVILKCLSVEPCDRPTLQEIAPFFWEYLKELDLLLYENLRLQMAYLEEQYQSNTSSHLKERLEQVEAFYA